MMDCLRSQNQQEQLSKLTTYQHMEHRKNEKVPFIKKIISKLSISTLVIVALLFACGYLFAKISHLEEQFRTINDNYHKRSVKLQKYNRLWKNMLHDQYNIQKINIIRELSQTQSVFQENPTSKVQYLLSMKNYPLSFYNESLIKEIEKYQIQVNSRMENIYDYNLPQLPLCILSYSTNNSHNFRNEHSLISILNQNYENYKVIIFDDFSQDDSYFVLQQFILDKNLSDKLLLIKSDRQQNFLKYVYNGVMNYCSQKDIIITVNGDDQLLGNNVFKIFNHFYQQNNLSFAYSKGLKSINDNTIEEGSVREFTLEEMIANSYKNFEAMPIFNLISFKASLFKQLQWTSLPHIDDSFWNFPVASVLWEPMLERSCRKKQLIPQFFYLSYQGLGNLDLNHSTNKREDQWIFKKDLYLCQEQ